MTGLSEVNEKAFCVYAPDFAVLFVPCTLLFLISDLVLESSGSTDSSLDSLALSERLWASGGTVSHSASEGSSADLS